MSRPAVAAGLFKGGRGIVLAEKWCLIYDPPAPGAANMRRDLEILEKVRGGGSPPVLRLYSWSPPALSLGRFQKTAAVADREECRRLGIDIVRRPTGGRAVLHDRELTYSFAVPDVRSLIPAGVVPSYRFISRALLDAFTLLGIEAELSPDKKRDTGLAPGSCFDAPSAYELRVQGKKVVGSAQMRRDGMLLQHGSILLKLSLETYRRVLRFNPSVSPLGGDEEPLSVQKESYLKALGSEAAGLLDLGYEIEKDDLAAAVAEGFARLFKIGWIGQQSGR